MSTSGTGPLSAVVEAHGVAFELSATPQPPSPITPENFQKFVDKLTRMTLGFSREEAETLRDELLIVDAFGHGVQLDRLAEHHPLSITAAVSAKIASDASQVRIRAFDPVLDPKHGET